MLTEKKENSWQLFYEKVAQNLGPYDKQSSVLCSLVCLLFNARLRKMGSSIAWLST